MKNKKNISILSITTLILLIASVLLGILISNNKNEEKKFSYNDYTYFKISDEDNFFWENDPILFATDTKLITNKYHGAIFD